MASYPSIEFPNNVIPEVFNKNSFVSKALKSDDIITSSLNVLGPSTLNTVQSNSINNTSNLTSNTITSTGLLTCSNGLSVTGGILNYGSLASSGSVSCNNGFSVTSGTVSFPANAIGLGAVNGLGTTLARLQNLTGSVAVVSTITSNVLTINYSSNNGQAIFVTPTANFSLVITNVSTSQLQAIYKLEIYITGRFYCTGITVNGTSLTMVAVNGMANIASQVNASATVLIQTFTIFFTGSTTPSRVITELKSTW
jgi:hypothetical protein